MSSLRKRTLYPVALLVLGSGLLVISAFPGGAHGQESKDLINVQARVLQDGVPTNADLDLTFELYETPTGGSALWSEARTQIAVRAGILATSLGDVTPLGDVFKGAGTTDDRYLAVKLAGQEIVPRIRLTAVPYAHRAMAADVTSALWNPGGGPLTLTDLDARYFTDASQLAGSGLEEDGAGKLRVASTAAGDGLTGGSGTALAVNPAALINGGAVALDGDRLEVEFVPTNYTRTTGGHATDVTDLTAHLQGIDDALGSTGGGGGGGGNVISLTAASTTLTTGQSGSLVHNGGYPGALATVVLPDNPGPDYSYSFVSVSNNGLKIQPNTNGRLLLPSGDIHATATDVLISNQNAHVSVKSLYQSGGLTYWLVTVNGQVQDLGVGGVRRLLGDLPQLVGGARQWLTALPEQSYPTPVAVRISGMGYVSNYGSTPTVVTSASGAYAEFHVASGLPRLLTNPVLHTEALPCFLTKFAVQSPGDRAFHIGIWSQTGVFSRIVMTRPTSGNWTITHGQTSWTQATIDTGLAIDTETHYLLIQYCNAPSSNVRVLVAFYNGNLEPLYQAYITSLVPTNQPLYLGGMFDSAGSNLGFRLYGMWAAHQRP